MGRALTAMKKVDVLIAGAGPTGMAAALALSGSGKSILIIDKHEKGLGFSRAIFINPDTLKALEPYGVTQKIAARGRPVRSIAVSGSKGLILDADFSMQDYKNKIRPINLAQLDTEQCMKEALEEKNSFIERPWQLVHFTQDAEGVTATLQNTLKTGETKTVRADYLLGCDGFHSVTREILGIKMETKELDRNMLGIDVEMDWNYKGDVSSWLTGEGGIIAIRLGENLVRFGAMPMSMLKKVKELAGDGQIIWQREFGIHFAYVKQYGRGRVWLAGDAAHVHSPVGGRGLNHGIADGLRLGKAVLDGDFGSYEQERSRINIAWVKANRRLTTFIVKQSFFGIVSRRTATLFLSIAAKISRKTVGRMILRKVSGA
jgi:2-polyprenyl-6-methoxyphenol hydroxylase-like FAD-dependent oxidoreductase